jgi:hypothetical protein
MTEWIDYGVYVAFIAGFYFAYPHLFASSNRSVLAQRNADWLASHPEAPTRFSGSRAYLWTSYLCGAAWLVVLTVYQTGALPAPAAAPSEKWQLLWAIQCACGLFGLALCCAGALAFQLRVLRSVPIAEQRHATLERRAIDTFVPRLLRLGVYTVVSLHLGAWLAVGALRLYSTPGFWARVVSFFCLSAIFWGMTYLVVTRRPIAAARLLGPPIRRAEVRLAFLMQLLPVIIGTATLYEEVTTAPVGDIMRAIQLVLIGFIATVFLKAGLPAKPPPSARECSSPPAPAESRSG